MSARNPTRFDPEALAAAYAAGESIPAVSRRFGCTAPTVIRALRACGVPSRSISDAVSAAKRGKRRISNGYVAITVEKHVRRKEHVLIAERALGRPLKRHEHVHHINCDPTDNRSENLLICSRSYHTALHWRMRRDPYWSQFPKERT